MNWKLQTSECILQAYVKFKKNNDALYFDVVGASKVFINQSTEPVLIEYYGSVQVRTRMYDIHETDKFLASKNISINVLLEVILAACMKIKTMKTKLVLSITYTQTFMINLMKHRAITSPEKWTKRLQDILIGEPFMFEHFPDVIQDRVLQHVPVNERVTMRSVSRATKSKVDASGLTSIISSNKSGTLEERYIKFMKHMAMQYVKYKTFEITSPNISYRDDILLYVENAKLVVIKTIYNEEVRIFKPSYGSYNTTTLDNFLTKHIPLWKKKFSLPESIFDDIKSVEIIKHHSNFEYIVRSHKTEDVMRNYPMY